jgi:hypothetical protein
MKLFGSKRRRKESTYTATRNARVSSFEAVAIQHSGEACQAAQDASGRRYLCSGAPLLPLADCDRPDSCACRYARFPDRRGGPRRKSEGALPSVEHQVSRQEARDNQGRRGDELGELVRPVPWLK